MKKEIKNAMVRAGITKYLTFEKEFESKTLTTAVHGFLIKHLESEIRTIEVNDPIIGKYDEVNVLKHRYRVTIVEL